VQRRRAQKVKSIGARLRRWRATAALTQQAAAERIGVSPAIWCEWEADKKRPVAADTLVDIELLTGIRLEDWSAREDARRRMRLLVARRVAKAPVLKQAS